MWKEFSEFALCGNVVDMAVGIIVGAAFGSIVKSLVDGIIMPRIGLLLGTVDFASFFILLKEGSPAAPCASLADAQAAGAVTINYGAFANAVISFFVVALVVFLLMRTINRLRREEEAPPGPTKKECPYCLTTIPSMSSRCACCTSELG